MQRLPDLPLLVILIALAGVAMVVPAVHGYSLGDENSGRPFFYGAITVLVLATMLGLATMTREAQSRSDAELAEMTLAYLVLPPILALPFAEALPDTRFANVWFEMLSSFTTTGATLYDMPGRLTPTLHLWRALVGWLGGFYIMVMAVAVLLPMNLGGMEVLTGRAAAGQGFHSIRTADARERLARFAAQLFPAYAGFTLLLWIGLALAGEGGFLGLCLAMATISSSGVMPDGLHGTASSGLWGEALIAVFLCLGLSRRAYPGALFNDRDLPVWRDPEIRMAAGIVAVVVVVLIPRHWMGAIAHSEFGGIGQIAAALAGVVFTTLSFLSTNGLVSWHWETARLWAGLETHGLILLGLTIFGGGVATTAGGVKLLRVYALFRLGEREVERLIHPRSVGGGGALERRLRSDGAQLAWVFFMLFGLSILVFTGALTLIGVAFDPALVLSISALTTTGPLANFALEAPVRYAELGLPAKAILGIAMILGRVELLAVLALLAPDRWRR